MSTFASSKLKRTALKQSVKSDESKQLRHQSKGNFVVLMSLLVTLNIFYILLWLFCINSDQVNAEWRLLYSLPNIQRQSPTGVFQEKYCTNI